MLDTSRALRIQANLSKEFWSECVFTATYLINRIPIESLGWKSPYEVLFKEVPSYEYLRGMGCLCFVANHPTCKDKFEARVVHCIFLGYVFGKKGYRV